MKSNSKNKKTFIIIAVFFILVCGVSYIYFNVREIDKKEIEEKYKKGIELSIEAEKKLNQGENKKFYEGYTNINLYSIEHINYMESNRSKLLLNKINYIFNIGDSIKSDTLLYLSYMLKASYINSGWHL